MGIPIPSTETIITLIKKGLTLEAQEKIIDLRMIAVDLQVENVELKERLAEYKKKADLREKVIWEPPYYFLPKDERKKDGPFCQYCMDHGGELIRLQEREKGEWECFGCKTVVYDSSFNSRGTPDDPRER